MSRVGWSRWCLVLTASLVLLPTGCGDVKSSSPPSGYLREGPAIAQARERRQEEQQRKADEAAETQRQQIAAATQAAVAEATANRTAQPARPAVATGQIKHVVVMWLKNPGDAVARKAVLDAGETLRGIPGVVDVAGGQVVPSDRAVVDSSYDVAFIVTLADAEALKNYGPHPIHQKAVKDAIQPNVARYVVYDFVLP